MAGQFMSSERQVRFFSGFLLGLGAILLALVVVFYANHLFAMWLAGQEKYLAADQLIGVDIPATTPTLTPVPTSTPVPMPAVRIIIPKIDVNAVIVEIDLKVEWRQGMWQGVWDTAAYAVGHRQNSAHPGERGNIVLSGHNNTEGAVFRRLAELAPGDEVFVYTLDEEFVYVVEHVDIVRAVGASSEEKAKHAAYTARTPDETLTLVSCWPYITYTHRVYVVAKPKGQAE
jgi:LPXTG-site transpeptidase (sortase) family protein